MNQQSFGNSEIRPISVLWLGFLGTSILWFIGFLYAWVLAEFGCQGAPARITFMGATLVAWFQLVGRLFFISIAILLLRYVNRVIKKASSGQRAEAGFQDESLLLFFARGGLIAGLILLAVIIVESIPIFFFLKSC